MCIRDRGAARVFGNAQVFGNARVSCDAKISGSAIVRGGARVRGNARIDGFVAVGGEALVAGDALITKREDLLTISNQGGRNAPVTFAKSAKGGLLAFTGCFHGTVEAFEKAVVEKHGDNVHGRKYLLCIEFAKRCILEVR